MEKVAFREPRIPVVNNVDVAFGERPEAIREALARQACNPVRWVEVIRALAAAGATDIVECGPGKVLAGLTRRIDSGLRGHAVADPRSLAQTLEALG
jgi:[acyl-carrier-protein] S-malonyltransferase